MVPIEPDCLCVSAVVAVVVPTKQRTRQPPPSKPWKSRDNSGGAADPEIVIVAPPRPSGSQRAWRPASGRVASSSGAQRSTAGPTAAPEGSFPAGLTATAAAAPAKAGRKSVAGVPMRVPGGPLLGHETSSSDVGGAAMAAAAVPSGRRRTSMMPQRVPYNAYEAPARPAPVAAASAGFGRAPVAAAGMSGADIMSHQTVPDSPESYAHSDTSGMGEGAVAGLDHKGVTTR